MPVGTEKEKADEFILERYRSIVETIKRRLRVREQDALDTAHDVIAAIYDSLERYDPSRGPFEAWVAGIIRNFVLRYFEGRGRKFPRREAEEIQPGPPVEEMVLREVRGFLAAALDRQPAIYRDVMRMRYQEGSDIKDIARSLRVPVGTVKARLSRAPALLRSVLQVHHTTARFYLDREGRR